MGRTEEDRKGNQELVAAHKFNEKFKNPMRDYYGYGFKSYQFYEHTGSVKTYPIINGDWNRLCDILAGYFEWTSRAGMSKARFASADSQSLERNPLQKVYHFCKYNDRDPIYFFHMLSALSGDIGLRDGLDALGLEEEDLDRMKRILYTKKKPSTAVLMCYYPDGFPLFKGENKTLNARLDDLARIGFLSCERENRGKNRYWSLSPVTMGKILRAAETAGMQDAVTGTASLRNAAETAGIQGAVNGTADQEGMASGTNLNFEERFRMALTFYSEYFLFGEAGMFLLDRLGRDGDSPFRFKHEYFAQSLNDYNLYDLIDAIENGKWCRIRTTHGISGTENILLLYPLELRISALDGREYVMCYNPFTCCCMELRVDFIDFIEFLEKKNEKGEDVSEEAILQILGISREALKRELEKAGKLLGSLWGVSPLPEDQRNLFAPKNPDRPSEVRLKIQYDPKKEAYIFQRLKKECRIGKVSRKGNEISFKAEVWDPGEMRPWIRSLYTRIVECEGLGSREFFKEDIEAFFQGLWAEELPGIRRQQELAWGIPPLYLKKLDELAVPAREHENLFHENFSVHFYVMADIFMKLCLAGDGEWFPEDRKFLGRNREWFPEDGKLLGRSRGNREAVGIREIRENDKVRGTGEIKGSKEVLRDQGIKDLVADSIEKYQKEISTNMNQKEMERMARQDPSELVDQIWAMLMDGGFLDTKEILLSTGKGLFREKEEEKNKLQVYRLKYGYRGAAGSDPNFYRDIVPLGILERKWLLTVLDDERISGFLSPQEIQAVKEAVMGQNSQEAFSPEENIPKAPSFGENSQKAPSFGKNSPKAPSLGKSLSKASSLEGGSFRGEISPLPMDRVKYFDRFHFPLDKLQKENQVLGKLLEAIKTSHTVAVSYITKGGKLKKEVYRPILLEFSKRENHFMLSAQDSKGNICILNLSGIEALNIRQQETFDHAAAKRTLEESRKNMLRYVEIEFYDIRGVADRILTEFTPWKKECKYDSRTDKYRLKIYYQEGDEKEITIRLMGYGAGIRFCEEDHPISREIAERLTSQLELLKTGK